MGLIRFLLACSVLIVHSSSIFGIQIIPGYLAVEVFYIISGFYMTLVFTEKYAHTVTPVWEFYVNRLLRLYPLYLTVVLMILVLSLIYGYWLGSFGKIQYYTDLYERQPHSLGSLIVILVFNFSLIGQDIITFFGIDAAGNLSFNGFQNEIKIIELLFIPIAWTVAVEIFFYILTPFIVKKRLYFLVFVMAAVLLLRLILFVFFDVKNGFVIYRFAPTELFWFLLGIFSFRFYDRGWLPDKKLGAWALGVWVIILFTYKYYEIDWIIFAFAFFFTPAVFYRFSKSPIDRYLGDLTYPLYIGHIFFIMIISANRFPKNYGIGLPLFILTLIFSILSVHFILKPIDRFRLQRVQNSTVPPEVIKRAKR
jgi:peptidoglycan/LPS O-acetylase OafA/YrhL